MNAKQLEHFRNGIKFQLSSINTVAKLKEEVVSVIEAYTDARYAAENCVRIVARVIGV